MEPAQGLGCVKVRAFGSIGVERWRRQRCDHIRELVHNVVCGLGHIASGSKQEIDAGAAVEHGVTLLPS